MTGSRPKLLKLVALKRQKAEQSLAIVQTELRDLGKQLDALQEEFASADQAGGDVRDDAFKPIRSFQTGSA